MALLWPLLSSLLLWDNRVVSDEGDARDSGSIVARSQMNNAGSCAFKRRIGPCWGTSTERLSSDAITWTVNLGSLGGHSEVGRLVKKGRAPKNSFLSMVRDVVVSPFGDLSGWWGSLQWLCPVKKGWTGDEEIVDKNVLVARPRHSSLLSSKEASSQYR